MKKLNLGAGQVVIEGVESQDINADFKPDHCFDMRSIPWPLEDNSYDEIYFFHCIEHIEKRHHRYIIGEVHRILKWGGLFVLSFPEFEIIAKNWLENFEGRREFWEATVYGAQRSKADYHLCAMDATETRDQLIFLGFKDIQVMEEVNAHYNTVIRCLKTEPKKSYEEVLYEGVIKDHAIQPSAVADSDSELL